MRSLLLALVLLASAVPAWGDARAQGPGTPAERVNRASSLDPDHGIVVISIRSELYLEEPLDVFFLREGGEITDPEDVVTFGRRQGFFAFGNDTTEWQVRSYQLPEGTYRLVAHGIDCPKVPAEDERCVVDRQGLTGRVAVPRPSRGYGEDAPTFEVRAGAVTYAGDFALTARNTIEWSEIPPSEMREAKRRFGGLAQGPEPVVPEEFRLRYGLTPRGFDDDYGRRY
jgi:hypothetical protein